MRSNFTHSPVLLMMCTDTVG